ncbi:MAG: hypothetical protein ABIJ03_03650 [Patescibacteria group bacterium]|nr:hypothetical protein [Patescibacteria group bacterium]
MSSTSFSDQEWFKYLDARLQKRVELAEILYQRELKLVEVEPLSDYTFLVFSMSKAYEGFLKQFLRDQNLITEQTYQSRRFRIGRALNPDIPLSQRDQYWLYDDVAKLCGDELARGLWSAWLNCRNRLFHFFPGHDQSLTLAQANERLLELSNIMTRALSCELIQSLPLKTNH